MKMIKLSKYAKNNGICYMTAYRHFHLGLLKGVQLQTGTILIEDNNLIDEKIKKEQNKNVVLYARVSSTENRKNLDSQLNRLRDFASAKGYNIVKEVKEIGSGLNDGRRKLEQVFKNDDWNILLVEHKDRLARFGINYLEVLLNKQNKKIEIINQVNNEKEDVMQDFISIITSFSAKIYGLRRGKRKTEELIKKLKEK